MILNYVTCKQKKMPIFVQKRNLLGNFIVMLVLEHFNLIQQLRTSMVATFSLGHVLPEMKNSSATINNVGLCVQRFTSRGSD